MWPRCSWACGFSARSATIIRSIAGRWMIITASPLSLRRLAANRRLVRDICTSRTYQLSTSMNDTNSFDERNFSHATLRRIRAELLLDCISQATETKDKFAGLPLGARAVQIADGNTATYFLTTFGRA